jgi:YesN/AraC family two-component response regulator
MRNSLERFMRRRFGEVYLAQNGEEGLALYIKHNPDIVITNIEMPVMNGSIMINKIMEIKSDQPIIITTAFNNDEYTSTRFVNLIKPIVVENLIDAVISCIGGRRHGAL